MILFTSPYLGLQVLCTWKIIIIILRQGSNLKNSYSLR